MVLAGGVPKQNRPYLFGANLHALRKKDGGLRPIADGLTVRRLVSKVANRWGVRTFDLSPGPSSAGGRSSMWSQMCFARAYLAPSSPWQALVKLDFLNA